MRKKKEELELSKYDNELSNLENKISDVMLMCCHLETMWKQADLLTAHKLQICYSLMVFIGIKKMTVIEPLQKMQGLL